MAAQVIDLERWAISHGRRPEARRVDLTLLPLRLWALWWAHLLAVRA